MSKGINLVGNKQQVISQQLSPQLRLLRNIAIISLFSIAAVSGVLFILISASPLEDLKKKEEAALVTMATFRTDIAKLMLVNERLDTSSALIKGRSDYAKAVNALTAKMPPEISVSSMNIDQEQVSLTVTSKSLQPLDTFLNNLIAATEAKENFSRVTLSSLMTDNQKNVFTLTVSVATL